MKKKINIKLVFIYLTFLFFVNGGKTYSQFDNIGQECGTESSGDYTNIPVKTPGSSDYLRCLIIYVTFPDDTTSGYNYTIWEKPTTITPNSKPVNPYSGTNGNLIDSLVGNPSDPFMTRYHYYTLSDFFCEMSMGDYDVIGDEIAITLPLNSTQYRDAGYNRGSLNRYVLNYLDSTRDIDWSRYDNWSYDAGWIFEPDGTAEMIMMNYRLIPNNSNGWFWHPTYGGEASLALPSSITFGNVTIGSFNGITALNLLHATGRAEFILEHEYSHKLFGYEIPLAGAHINMGMMTPGHNNTSYIMTPVERSAPVINYIPINVIDQTGIYTDTLPDYTESGISYKIKIPGSSNEYVWIANHQKKSVYDGIARGGSNCYDINFGELDPYCSDGKGLIIYRQGYGCSNLNEPYDVVSAKGKYDWTVNREVYVPAQNYHHPLGFTLPVLEQNVSNRFYGKDKYWKVPSTNSVYGTWIEDDECSQSENDFFISVSFRGDKYDAFNIGYEEIFSPYSNPSSNSCNSGNTGLTIALKEQDSLTGAIIVKIYYNNNDQALSDLPPSKPKNLKVIAETVTDNVSFYPKLTWDNNIEPDFTSAYQNPTVPQTRYAVYKSISTSCTGEQTYSFLEEVDTNVYIDSSNLMYVSGSGPGPCSYYQVAASYKVSAIDNTDKESVKSERAVIKGYFDPCGAIGEDNISQNINSNEELSFNLYQNFPNPFNPVTIIMYDLPKDNNVTLKVYDILGKEVMTLVDEFKSAGRHTVNFDATSDADALPNGVYYYKIVAGEFSAVRRMLLIK